MKSKTTLNNDFNKNFVEIIFCGFALKNRTCACFANLKIGRTEQDLLLCATLIIIFKAYNVYFC